MREHTYNFTDLERCLVTWVQNKAMVQNLVNPLQFYIKGEHKQIFEFYFIVYIDSLWSNNT